MELTMQLNEIKKLLLAEIIKAGEKNNIPAISEYEQFSEYLRGMIESDTKDSVFDFYSGIGDLLGDSEIYISTPISLNLVNDSELLFSEQCVENKISLKNAFAMIANQLELERNTYKTTDLDISINNVGNALIALNAMGYDLDTVVNM